MSSQQKWKVGEQEFEALMRMLDNLVRAHLWQRPCSLWELLSVGSAAIWQMILSGFFASLKMKVERFLNPFKAYGAAQKKKKKITSSVTFSIFLNFIS